MSIVDLVFVLAIGSVLVVSWISLADSSHLKPLSIASGLVWGFTAYLIWERGRSGEITTGGLFSYPFIGLSWIAAILFIPPWIIICLRIIIGNFRRLREDRPKKN